MMQVFDYIVIAYITLRAFTEINLKKNVYSGAIEATTFDFRWKNVESWVGTKNQS
jgi:hypothetical protein